MITLKSDKYSADSCFPLPLLTIYIQALNEGELSSHKLDEIWSSFGAELTEVKDTTEQNRTEQNRTRDFVPHFLLTPFS